MSVGFLDLIDRMHERRMRAPRRPLDVKAFIGLLFLGGYYLMVIRFMDTNIPAANIPLVRDAMLVLGPAVGLIVGALFRSDVRDEQQTANTGLAFRAMGEQAKANAAASAQQE
jgi:hypothetical protein